MTRSEELMYGLSEERIRKEYLESITAQLSGNEMVVMSILSDCQEMLHHATILESQSEPIRKQLNVAKFILSEMMDNRRRSEGGINLRTA